MGTLGYCLAAPLSLIRERRRAARRSPSEFDRQFGVETDGFIPLRDLDIESRNWVYGIQYQPASPAVVYQALAALAIDFQDFTFIDFGSGKGRALLVASEFPFKRIIGLEFSPELHAIAQQNVRRYQSKTQRCKTLESICGDFATFPVPAEPVVCFFNNPCGEPVMAKALGNIQRSLHDHPRQIYIIYLNPDFAHLLEKTEFVKVQANQDCALYAARS